MIVLFLLLLFIFWPVQEAKRPTPEHYTSKEQSEFMIHTTKQNLNELINAYIDKMLARSNHNYQISLEEDVHLLGDIPVFSSTVPLSIHLDPIVQENGDLILRQKSISIGLLKLPNKKIMEYLKKYLPMPEWVIIDPKKEEIYVAISEMDIRSNFQVSIEQFDLDKNLLSFKINVPYQTLGIDGTRKSE